MTYVYSIQVECRMQCDIFSRFHAPDGTFTLIEKHKFDKLKSIKTV